MLARCRVHEVSQEWGCEWGSSYMNESIHSVSSHDCRFLPNRMRGGSLVITPIIYYVFDHRVQAKNLLDRCQSYKGTSKKPGPFSILQRRHSPHGPHTPHARGQEDLRLSPDTL